MELVLPLNKISGIKGLKLPVVLYNKSRLRITLEPFSLNEKKWFFNLEELKIRPDGGTITRSKAPFAPHRGLTDQQELLLTKYKAVIKKRTSNPSELQRIETILAFALKVLIGSSCTLNKFRDTRSMFNGVAGFSGRVYTSRRADVKLDKNLVERVKKLLVAFDKDFYSKEELRRLNSLLQSAMSQFIDLGLSGSLYVAILESIFAAEQDSEIGYRFSMRAAGLRGGGLEYGKKIKKLYNKRSKMFPSGINGFENQDVAFLESEACWAIESYALNQEIFARDNLDERLLT